MNGLRQKLLEEERFLKDILNGIGDSEEEVLEGTLRISMDKNKVRYFHHIPSGNGKKYDTYIPKTNKELPVQLAQNTYNNKLRSLVKKRLEQLRRILKDYDDNEIDVLYTKEHPERQKLIKPIQPTWEQRLSEWEKEEYKGKTFAENIPVITTAKGERVRSKSEKILADYFYHTGIILKYEHPVILKRFGIVYPDFTFLSPKTGEEIYWEHDGRMDDPEYARKAIKKIETYEKNGIFPGQRLVLTFETLQDGLDMKIVEKLAREYLL